MPTRLTPEQQAKFAEHLKAAVGLLKPDGENHVEPMPDDRPEFRADAVNREDELFSDPKLLEIANQNLDLPLKEFTVSIKREIDKFADGAEQADDITMLSLRYKGRQSS